MRRLSVHLLGLWSWKAGGTELHTSVLSMGRSLELVFCGPESPLGAALFKTLPRCPVWLSRGRLCKVDLRRGHHLGTWDPQRLSPAPPGLRVEDAAEPEPPGCLRSAVLRLPPRLPHFLLGFPSMGQSNSTPILQVLNLNFSGFPLFTF